MPKFSIRRKPSFSKMKGSFRLRLILWASCKPGGQQDQAREKTHSTRSWVPSTMQLPTWIEPIQSIIERLRHERNISDRTAVQVNSDVRAEMARAITLADAKRNELTAEVSFACKPCSCKT